MNQSRFNNYKSVKEKFNYSIKGYNLKDLVPGYLGFIFDDLKPVLRDIFKGFYTSTKILDLRKVVESRNSTIITYLISRTDYKELAYAAQQLYPEAKVISLSDLPLKKISPLSITYLYNLFLSFRIIFGRSIGSNLYSKLYNCTFLIKILNQIFILEKKQISLSVEKYICFNSAYREEAILTSFFNKRNIETITMQHGIFCDFKLHIPFDIINQENLLSQKLLCWGQSTVDYMTAKGIDKSRFILEGNLKYRNIEIDEINQTFKHCLVLLGRGNYVDTNNKLLELVTQYNRTNNNQIVFYIKKHPFLSDNEHKKFASIADNIIFLGKEHSVQEILKSDLVDFSIAVNTTAYYESLALAKPCLRWTESENEKLYGMDDKFNNIEEFDSKMQEIKQKDKLEIAKEVKSIIKYIFNPNLSI